MADTPNADRARIEQARSLVTALERGDEALADQIIDQIGAIRETRLFQEVGMLTRQLHDTLSNFALDAKLVDLTEKDIPDAKERLNYVIAMTEQAANVTLNAVESILPTTAQMGDRAGELGRQWQRFRQREMAYEEFKVLSQELGEHLEQSQKHFEDIQSRLTEVLMAQGFQDLTGQIIRRVIQLVQDMESNMVNMIRLSGSRFATELAAPAAPASSAQGPSVPGLDSGAVHNQDDVDALLSSLGF